MPYVYLIEIKKCLGYNVFTYYNIIGITETWLDKSYDWKIHLKGYCVFGKDGKCKEGKKMFVYCTIMFRTSSKIKNIYENGDSLDTE